jgi:autotransporter adhesin
VPEGKLLNSRRRARFAQLPLIAIAVLIITTGRAQAQTSGPVVGACSGVQLPRSVVTNIMAPVIGGMATPTENSVNSILDIIATIPLVGALLPDLDIDAPTLLSNAAAGAPITLQVVNSNGTVVGPADQCNLQSDSFSLATEGGISIGGNRITGLGANGDDAFSGNIDAVALGNGARVEAAATGSIALGHGAQVTVANSVAIGDQSQASRGPQLAYAAIGLVGPQDSAGELSVGAAGAERQITNVAPGSAPTDAVNVAQLQGVDAHINAVDARVTTVAADVAVLAGGAVQYDGPAHDRVTLDGAAGTIIDNVAPGTLAAGSAEAVNGAQLHATNQAVNAIDARVTANTNAITNLDIQVANNTLAITNLTSLIGTLGPGGTVTADPVQYSDASSPTTPNGGTPSNDVTLVGAAAGPVGVHNVADGAVAAGSTDAVNGGQLYATNQAVDTARDHADQALVLASNSVQYDADGSVTLGDGTTAVELHNVASGVAATDAVNVGQLNASMQNAVTQANAYTDMRFDMIDLNMSRIQRNANAGTATALAAAALPQASDPGHGMVSLGVATYQGQQAFAFGMSARLPDARTVFRAGVAVDSRGRAGANAGVGVQF